LSKRLFIDNEKNGKQNGSSRRDNGSVENVIAAEVSAKTVGCVDAKEKGVTEAKPPTLATLGISEEKFVAINMMACRHTIILAAKENGKI
jgi:hypothetical protein